MDEEIIEAKQSFVNKNRQWLSPDKPDIFSTDFFIPFFISTLLNQFSVWILFIDLARISQLWNLFSTMLK